MNARDDLATAADLRLEEHIERVTNQVKGLILLGQNEAARTAARKLAALIAARSPEQVARMERERGLQR